jgi:plasmid stabilization system protein ParE
MIRYVTRISKNGVVYYIAAKGVDIGDTVIVRLTKKLNEKEDIVLGVFIRRVVRLGNRKIITLPHRFVKIWRILHGQTVEVSIEKVETANIEEIIKKIVLSFRQNTS